MNRVLRALISIAATISVVTTVGCGGNSGTTTTTKTGCSAGPTSSASVSCPVRTPVAGVSLAGKVLAQQQPLDAASVQLYAAGIGGNGSAPTALSTAATTGLDGSFTIPGGYTCPSAQTPIYLLSKGGKPGNSGSSPSLWLMTAIGTCGSIGAGSTFIVDEVTTVAAVWALAPFLSSGGNVGSTCTNVQGLDNAFATANSLANAATGTSPGAGNPSTAAVPTTKLNTLANALASCSGSSGGAACTTLLNAAVTGNAAPTNTIDAALNIAHSPAANVAAIYALAAASPVFPPALSTAPPDWMLANTITGGGMSTPTTVSVAATGDVWVASYFNAVSEFSPAGVPAFPAGITGYGINESYGMALDAQGDVWIANQQTTSNQGSGNVTELSATGQELASGLTGGGINFPTAVAAAPNGDMWFVDYGDAKVTLLNGSGAPLSSSAGWGGTSLALPVAVAVDSSNNAWVANQSGLLPITKISLDGSQVTNYDCNCNGASGVAIDQSNNVWVANYYGNSISEVNSCGTLALNAATGGGVNRPQGIAVDGAGTVWVSNFLGDSLSQLSGASSAAPGTFLSPAAGFGTDAALGHPYSVAVDASGNLWVANSAANSLTEFIGVAAPVKTPLIGPPQAP